LAPSAGLSGGTSKPATWSVATTSYDENGNRAQPSVLILDHDHPLQGEYDKVATSAAYTVGGVLDTKAWKSVSALSFDDQEEVLAGMLNKQLQGTFSINGDSTFTGHKLKIVSTDANGGMHLKDWSDSALKSGFERWNTEGGKWPLGESDSAEPEQVPQDEIDGAESQQVSQDEGDGAETDQAPLAKGDDTDNEKGERAPSESDSAEPEQVPQDEIDGAESQQVSQDEGDGAETDQAPLAKGDETDNEKGERAPSESDGAETKQVSLAESDGTEDKQADEV
jgi:hypothetical protein